MACSKPSLTRPSLGFEHAIYNPTITEVAVTAGSVALFAILFLLFFKIFPAISVWEVEEGEEIDLDYMVDAMVAVRGNMTPDSRVFMQSAYQREKNLAISILLDLSESTNERTGPAGISVPAW